MKSDMPSSLYLASYQNVASHFNAFHYYPPSDRSWRIVLGNQASLRENTQRY